MLLTFRLNFSRDNRPYEFYYLSVVFSEWVIALYLVNIYLEGVKFGGLKTEDLARGKSIIFHQYVKASWAFKDTSNILHEEWRGGLRRRRHFRCTVITASKTNRMNVHILWVWSSAITFSRKHVGLLTNKLIWIWINAYLWKRFSPTDYLYPTCIWWKPQFWM